VNRRDIPAVCIDTRDPNLAFVGGEHNVGGGRSRVVIFTDASGSEIIAKRNLYHIEVIVIDSISSIHEYGEFVLYRIRNFISSEFFIIFQWDGFAINEKLWNDNFLNYDFIGAPWIQEHKGDCGWVGNGGFSLRSERLMDSVTRLGRHLQDMPEDTFIAKNAEDLGRLGGVVIAPLEIARQFSIEHETTLPVNSDNYLISRRETFGFHGWFNFHLAFDDEKLVRYISDDMTEAQRRRVLASWGHAALLVNLERALRKDCLLDVAALTEAALGVAFDKSRPGYLQQLVDFIRA